MRDCEKEKHEQHDRRANDNVSDRSHLPISGHHRDYDRKENDRDRAGRATATLKQVAHSFASELRRGSKLKFDGHAGVLEQMSCCVEI